MPSSSLANRVFDFGDDAVLLGEGGEHDALFQELVLARSRWTRSVGGQRGNERIPKDLVEEKRGGERAIGSQDTESGRCDLTIEFARDEGDIPQVRPDKTEEDIVRPYEPPRPGRRTSTRQLPHDADAIASVVHRLDIDVPKRRAAVRPGIAHLLGL